MSPRTLVWMGALAFSCVAAPAAAKPDQSAGFRQIKAGEAIQLRPDRAYLLLRIDTSIGKFSADLLRIPTDAEMAAYDAARTAAYSKKGRKPGDLDSFVFDYEGPANFFEVAPKKSFSSVDKTALTLTEVIPGDYVLYAIGYSGFLYQCFCLGTVGFAAPAGVVTDLGTMIVDKASKPSAHPELAGEADLGPSASMDWQLFAVALRPQRPGDAMPGPLNASNVRAAQFHAVGPYTEAGTTLINRLAPIPGVLAYDGGRVIDVATGHEAPPR